MKKTTAKSKPDPDVTLVVFPTPVQDETWPREWEVHGQVLWKGKPLFNLVHSLEQGGGFFLRADTMPWLQSNWGAAGSLKHLCERGLIAAEEFKKLLLEAHQRPKVKVPSIPTEL